MKRQSTVLAGGVLAIMLSGWIAQSMAADEVLSGNVREADGSSGQNTNAGAGIKTNHLQNGAVTSAKIKDGGVATADLASGAVTSAKIKDGNVLAADLGSGSVTAAKVGFYSRVLIVDVNGGGDFTSPAAAMASIADASGGNPYLLKIMPGVYDVGQTPVQMQPYVDIEGSGEGVTRITGVASPGVVLGASNAEIRFLTIENTATEFGSNVAFYATQGASPSLLHVTAISAGGQSGYKIGVYCDGGAAPRLSHVKARGVLGQQTAGVLSSNAVPVLTDVEARGEGGVDFNQGVYLYLSDGATLRRVEASASGGSGQSFNAGINLNASSPIIADSTALAHGHPGANIGIRIEGESRPELTNVNARGLGGTAIGLLTLELNGGLPIAGYAVVADRCTFEGATSSVLNDREYEVTIGAGKLLGGDVDNSAGGTLRCLFTHGATTILSAVCVP